MVHSWIGQVGNQLTLLFKFQIKFIFSNFTKVEKYKLKLCHHKNALQEIILYFAGRVKFL